MGLASWLYFGAPTWVQDALISAYGWRLRRLRYGTVQRQVLAGLRESQWYPAERLFDLQMEALNAIVTVARESVPLYRERGLPTAWLHGPDDLRSVPLLTKAELQRPREQITSARFGSARLQEVHTGGTTGKPLTIYCDGDVLQRNYAFFGRFREWAGITPGARVATFAGRTIVPPAQIRPPYWRRNAAANTLLFSSYHIGPVTLPAYVERLIAFRPDLIDSYPSSIEPIARYVLERRIGQLRPKAVITSSETLLEPVRALIEAAFGCPVFDHYGAAEMAALVTQCAAGSYHVNPEFGLVEVLRDGQPVAPGESGDLVATGFINPVMPLIRYATGDTVVQGGVECACGRAFPTLERIEGRRDDVLIAPDGRRIGRLDPIFKVVASLYETRIIQDRADHVRVEMVLRGPLPADEERSLRTELENRLGPLMRVDLVRVERIPRTATGKFCAVINELAGQEAARTP